MERPALLLEDGLALPIPLSGPARRVVAGAVAFDREQETAFVIGVAHGEIDPEARRTYLRLDAVAVQLQRMGDVFLERTVHRRARQQRRVHLAGLGVLEKSPDSPR